MYSNLSDNHNPLKPQHHCYARCVNCRVREEGVLGLSDSIVEAYVLITTVMGKEYEVAEDLLAKPYVSEVAVLYGIYDVLVKVEASSLPELDKIISELRTDNRIRQTVTLIAANIMSK